MTKAGFIAIVGRPNAGKSTLLNRVLGTKVSIVSPKAQTTRERVLGLLTERREDVVSQIVFVDTPGIHRAKPGGINEFMVSEAREALDGPTAIWYIVDPASAIEHERTVIELLEKASKVPVFVLINKTDLLAPGKGAKRHETPISPDEQAARLARLEQLEIDLVAELKARGCLFQRMFKLSARMGTGIDELLTESWKLIPEHELFFPDEEQVSDRPMRFFVAEKVREQLFRCLGDEIPYSCAVEIERFDEESKPPRIEAVIHVERDSQKGMVIGKGGQKIKEIGTQARRQVELFMGSSVFLGLRVNVLKEWTRDAQAMKRMGYLLPDQGRKQGRARS